MQVSSTPIWRDAGAGWQERIGHPTEKHGKSELEIQKTQHQLRTEELARASARSSETPREGPLSDELRGASDRAKAH